VYAGTVQGRVLTFDVQGVWRRNMVMRDRETGTIWQHATGEAIAGPLAGAALTPLGGTLTVWSAWQRDYPHTHVAEDSPVYGLIPKQRLLDALQITHILHVPGIAAADRRLPAHEEIVGLVIKGEAKAYPLSAIKGAGRVEDSVGGVAVTLIYEADKDLVRAVGGPSGQDPLRVERQWWLGWSEFHPGSAIWRG
jgi:hypothetical protein